MITMDSREKTTSRKVVIASMLGTILEFYDFKLFGLLSPLLAPLFFPDSDPMMSLILILATYGVGFFTRPFGAIFFGHIGDRYGRKKALSLSVLLMAIPTFCIAILPTYDQIGVFSSLVLIALRLFQGFCTGGECNGAAIYVVESVSHQKIGFFGSLIAISGAIGGLSATLLSSGLTSSALPSYSWRFTFLLGSVVGVIGFYMRTKLPETHFNVSFSPEKNRSFPLIEALRLYPRSIICSMGISAFCGAICGLTFTYVSIFLTTQANWALSDSLLLMSTGTLTSIMACPWIGYLADRYGHKKVSLGGALLSVFCVYPLFHILYQSPTPLFVIGVQIGLGLLSAASQAPINAYLTTLFPPSVRYSGVSFSYSTGMALFGGTMPMISATLIKVTGFPMMPAVYVMALAIIGCVCIYCSRQVQT